LAGLRSIALAAAVLAASAGAAKAAPVAIVAAENFYGDVAEQIGGEWVVVTSILADPQQDPHSFETSASTARALSDADVIIYNGAGYDPWMPTLLAAVENSDADVIVAADLVGREAGDNPHIWYDPATMPAVAEAIAAALAAADPDHADSYAAGLQVFEDSLAPISDEIAAIRNSFGGAAVTATEPVFGYMADALGLAMRNQDFQLAVMNDTEPSARDLAAFEDDLRGGVVRVLFYNSQVVDDLTAHLRDVADQSGIPVVGVTELLPAGMTFQQWIAAELNNTRAALAVGSR
jgi:zinc/manganese transport system substrate-binding protein